MGLRFDPSSYFQAYQAGRQPRPDYNEMVQQPIAQGLQDLVQAKRQAMLDQILQSKEARENREFGYKWGMPLDPNAEVGTVAEPLSGPQIGRSVYMPGGSGPVSSFGQAPKMQDIMPRSVYMPGGTSPVGTGTRLVDAFNQWRAKGMKPDQARPEFMAAMGQDERKSYFDANTPEKTADVNLKNAQADYYRRKPAENAATLVYQNPDTGQVSAVPQSGWMPRQLKEGEATKLLSSSYDKHVAPTTQARNMGEMAATVIPHVEGLKNTIRQAAQAGFIGPVAGRVYVDFLAGKVGTTGDPQADRLLGQLRSQTQLMNSAVLRTHMGGRGGQMMLEHFQNMLNTGNQSEEQLNGTLDTIKDYMTSYANMGGANVPQDNSNPSSVQRIRVRKKGTNQTGTILKTDFDPAKYEAL